MSSTFEAGSWVWMPHDSEMFLPAQVVKTYKEGEDAEVKYEDGTVEKVDAARAKGSLHMDEAARKTYDNMIQLSDLNEPTILHNLRQRFMKDEIYTYVSSILVACNPFKLLPIYTPEVLDRYKDGGSRSQPPHIFAIADNAYASLQAEFKDQAVVISGESGAGKTETMKLVLQFLAEASGRLQKSDGSGEKTESLEQQILKSNPLMEAFGNAKTTRNDNSSRFGKWTEIKFNRGGAIVGGSIINYLLEKSRIPAQTSQERNYHVFYQLLAGVEIPNEFSQELKKLLRLRPAEEFNYLNQSGVTVVDGINDEKDWEEVIQAMDVLHMTHEEKVSVFRIVAAILHIGNVEFERDPTGSEDTDSKVKNPEQLAIASDLFAVDADNLAKALCFRKISRPGAKSVTYARNSIVRAKDVRDAMAKSLYGKLFDWLIIKINEALMQGIGSGAGMDLATIGVLDIFGFESFEVNSFEQLCINYCNEKLQQHFNSYIFKLEQEEYKREGVPVDLIEFRDNQATLDLLEMPKGEGIFSMIDEEIAVPRGSDETFLQKVITKHRKHEAFGVPRPRATNAAISFIVHHYAGEVAYTVTNFLEKNKDALSDDVTEVVLASKNPLVAKLLVDNEPTPVAGRAIRRRTLSFQFKDSLNDLMEAMHKCEPHFVRCMKTNDVKQGNVFRSDMMLAQLRYAGLLEVCRIRKVGFPVRKSFEDFVFRYRCLDLIAAAKGHQALCESLEKKGVLEPKQWVIGHTKVFVRNHQQVKLEEYREEALKDVVTKLTKVARGFIIRRRYARWKVILQAIRESIQTRTEDALETALIDVPELPLGGHHLKDVKEAVGLLQRIQEEKRITTLCKDAIEARDLAQLQGAVKAADDMQYTNDTVEEARSLLDVVTKERDAVRALRAAMETRELADIEAALASAASLGEFVTNNDAYKQAETLKVRIQQEITVRDRLQAAVAAASIEDISELVAALQQVAEMGMEQEEVAKAAEAHLESLREQNTALVAVKEAAAARDHDRLQSAVSRAIKVGVPESNSMIVEMRALESVLAKEKAVEDELFSVAESGTLDNINAAIQKAEGLGMTETAGLKKARARASRLQEEIDARERLVEAVKSKRAPAIASALSKYNELGLSGPELDKAMKAMEKLGDQSKAFMALETAVGSGDLAGIDKAVEELVRMGLQDEEQVVNAVAVKARVQRQNEVAEELTKALEEKNNEKVVQLMEEVPTLNFGQRFTDLFAEASVVVKQWEAESVYINAIDAALKNNDAEEFEAAVAKVDMESERISAAIEDGRALLKRRQDVLSALSKLLEDASLDADVLAALVEEAESIGLNEHARVQQAHNMLNREKNIKETRRALRRAMKNADIAALTKALDKAIAAGMEKHEETLKARDFLKKLDEEKELASGVNAAMKSLKVKSESAAGVGPGDLKPLEDAIQEARERGLPDESPFMKQALEALDRWTKVIEFLHEVEQMLASSSPSLRSMKKLLETADDLDIMSSSLVKRLRSRVREEEKVRSRAAMEDDYEEEALPSLDDEEQRRVREEKQNRARAAKYHFTRFPRIRHPDDFCKGIILNKKKVRSGQLRWSNTVIPTSILDFQSRDFVRTAIRIHKDILGYCGDKSMSFPATLARDILQKGLEQSDLVDEVYIQICKHLTANPRPESIIRGWQLMCMCVGTFPPSQDLENYLINFILEYSEGSGAVGNYARYSLRRLEGILNSGPSGFVPSVEEIAAYKERPPILATIELVDGTPLTEDLPITPDLNVGKVLDICNHFMELQDPRMQYFGIFVEDIDDEDIPLINPNSEDAPAYAGLSKTPRPLQNEQYMGDVVMYKVRQNQKFRFVYKRKIYLRNLDYPSEDPTFERLVYLQALDEVLRGNIPIGDTDEVALLAAQGMGADLGEAMGDTVDDLLDQGLLNYIPHSRAGEADEYTWAEKVLALRDDIVYTSPEELQNQYINAVRDHPLYGTCFFHVRKHKFPPHMDSFPVELIISLNSEGLHFLNEERETLASYGYADIYRWGGSSSQFSIIIWNAETNDTDDVAMFTSQAADMASLILDYITAIMNTQETT